MALRIRSFKRCGDFPPLRARFRLTLHCARVCCTLPLADCLSVQVDRGANVGMP